MCDTNRTQGDGRAQSGLCDSTRIKLRAEARAQWSLSGLRLLFVGGFY